jgi:hypothetical protein
MAIHTPKQCDVEPIEIEYERREIQSSNAMLFSKVEQNTQFPFGRPVLCHALKSEDEWLFWLVVHSLRRPPHSVVAK